MKIDKLCYSSKLRYVNPGEKFAYAVITLLLCIISRSVLTAAVVLPTNAILTVVKGGTPWRYYLKLMAMPLGFLLLSTLAVMINISAVPFDGYAIALGGRYLTASRESLMFGGQLILTALAAVSCLYFLALNTPMTEILGVFERLHCPLIIIELMLLIYRFIFVLQQAAFDIRTSQRSRLGYKDYRTGIHSFGLLGAALFVRAVKRSDALYDGMESRCYDGRIRVLKEGAPPHRKEIAAIILYEVLLLGIIVWRYLA